jgi:hypothetical protein
VKVDRPDNSKSQTVLDSRAIRNRVFSRILGYSRRKPQKPGFFDFVARPDNSKRALVGFHSQGVDKEMPPAESCLLYHFPERGLKLHLLEIFPFLCNARIYALQPKKPGFLPNLWTTTKYFRNKNLVPGPLLSFFTTSPRGD